eukprot:11130954-Alexandrium_andersonii.AAC.1
MADLAAWESALRVFLTAPTEGAMAARVLLWERAALEGRLGPGGAWSNDVVDALLERARGGVGWPLRPPG